MVRARLVLLLLVIAGAAFAQPRQPGWEVRIPERIETTLGEPATLTIAIAVDRGLVISKDAPVILDVTASGGVSVRRSRLGRSDAVDPEADAPRFSIPVRTTVAGEHAVKVRLRMWLCGGRSCRPLDLSYQTVVAVAQKPPVSAPNAGTP